MNGTREMISYSFRFYYWKSYQEQWRRCPRWQTRTHTTQQPLMWQARRKGGNEHTHSQGPLRREEKKT
jgi:hypothetical protein